MIKPILSIIIVNYNTGGLLRRCVQSIKQTTDSFQNPGCEVVVVDNASTDGSVDAIGNFQFPLSGRRLPLSNFQLFKNKKNVGFARAVNQGIKKAHGKYVLLLNPDTEVREVALKKMVECAQKTDDAGVIGARLLNPDGSTQPSVFRFPTPWRALQEFWLGKKVYSKYTPQGEDPVEVDAVIGAAFLITPQARHKVGLLDERYFMYFEDLDYCRRVRRADLRVYYLPEAEIVHYHGVSGKTLASVEDQWRRLVPSSKAYHGLFKHYLLNFIIFSGQKWQRIWHKS